MSWHTSRIPHKGRTVKPVAQDTIKLLKELLAKTVIKKSDCIILAGDFNLFPEAPMPQDTRQFATIFETNKLTRK